MLDSVRDALRNDAGIVETARFDTVHEGKAGRTDCRTSGSIESWSGMFYFAVEADLTKGPGFRRTRVMKWPYSRRDALDLDGVVSDLRNVARAPHGVALQDRRTGVGRFFDRLIGRNVKGTYAFASPIDNEPGFSVTATIEESGGQKLVLLTERAKGRGFIMSQIPQPAFAALADALEAFRRRP